MNLAGNQYSGQSIGAWPPQSPVYPYTLQDLYVDPVNGQDFNNPSGSQARPLKTLGEVARRLVGFQGATTIHLRSGDYVLPSSGVFLQSRMLNGLISIVADDVWDPTVFEVLLDTTAQAGSTETDIVVPGPLVKDEFAALTIESTSGSVVQRRTIRNTTTTDIFPCGGFNNFNIGDRIRVLRTRARIVVPQIVPDTNHLWTNYVFAQDSPAYRPGVGDFFPFFAKNESAINPAGLMLRGVALVNDPLTSNFFDIYFGKLPVYLIGVESREPDSLSFNDTMVYAGYGLASEAHNFGWGLGVVSESGSFSGDAGFLEGPGCRFFGTIVNVGPNSIGFGLTLDSPVGDVQYVSGRFSKLSIAGQAVVQILASQDGFTVPMLLDASGTGSAAADFVGSGLVVILDAIDLRGGGAGMVVEGGSNVTLFSVNCTGVTDAGDVVTVRGGAKLSVIGTPTNFGGGSNSWVVLGQPAFDPAVTFAAAGTGVLGTDNASLAVSV